MKRQDLRYKAYKHSPFSYCPELKPKPEPYFVAKLIAKRLLTLLVVIAIMGYVPQHWS